MTSGNIALGVGALGAFYAASAAWSFLRRILSTPLRDLPGPKNESFLWGNLRNIFKVSFDLCQPRSTLLVLTCPRSPQAENSVIHEQWVKEFGPTYRYYAFASELRLFTIDTRAIAHVLNNTQVWQKPEMIRRGLAEILGEGARNRSWRRE